MQRVKLRDERDNSLSIQPQALHNPALHRRVRFGCSGRSYGRTRPDCVIHFEMLSKCSDSSAVRSTPFANFLPYKPKSFSGRAGSITTTRGLCPEQ